MVGGKCVLPSPSKVFLFSIPTAWHHLDKTNHFVFPVIHPRNHPQISPIYPLLVDLRRTNNITDRICMRLQGSIFYHCIYQKDLKVID